MKLSCTTGFYKVLARYAYPIRPNACSQISEHPTQFHFHRLNPEHMEVEEFVLYSIYFSIIPTYQILLMQNIE